MDIIQISKVVLRVADVASLLNYSSHTIYQKIKAGEIAAYKNEGGRIWNIPATSLENYVQSKMSKREHQKLSSNK